MKKPTKFLCLHRTVVVKLQINMENKAKDMQWLLCKLLKKQPLLMLKRLWT